MSGLHLNILKTEKMLQFGTKRSRRAFQRERLKILLHARCIEMIACQLDQTRWKTEKRPDNKDKQDSANRHCNHIFLSFRERASGPDDKDEASSLSIVPRLALLPLCERTTLFNDSRSRARASQGNDEASARRGIRLKDGGMISIGMPSIRIHQAPALRRNLCAPGFRVAGGRARFPAQSVRVRIPPSLPPLRATNVFMRLANASVMRTSGKYLPRHASMRLVWFV